MQQALDKIKSLLPANIYLTDDEDKKPYESPWRGEFTGTAAMVIFPDNKEQILGIIKVCNEYNIAIIPQCGNTGLVCASTPDDTGTEIIINLSRMNRILAIDPINYTVTVEAGCILANLKEQLEQQNLLFPLSMASEGSAEIGGVISTNAGGTAVLRYGNTRQLVLGLEAVMPNGEIYSDLKGLRKDNTGYDIKQLLIGAEGTLGIVTTATLKLFPIANNKETALLCIDNLSDALKLFQLFRASCDSTLTAFELIPHLGMELVQKHVMTDSKFTDNPAPYYILIELASANDNEDLSAILNEAVEQAFNQEIITDGVIATNGKQAINLWALRENITEAEKLEGAMVNFDVSVPISSIDKFIKQAIAACSAVVSDIRPIPFGHIGDGNIHFNLLQPVGSTKEEFLEHKMAIKNAVYGVLQELNGSISAEHGIGKERIDEFHATKPESALSIMYAIKNTLDPNNIMNPDRLLRKN